MKTMMMFLASATVLANCGGAPTNDANVEAVETRSVRSCLEDAPGAGRAFVANQYIGSFEGTKGTATDELIANLKEQKKLFKKFEIRELFNGELSMIHIIVDPAAAKQKTLRKQVFQKLGQLVSIEGLTLECNMIRRPIGNSVSTSN